MFEGRIQRAFETTNRKDVQAVMSWWADDGVLEFPGRSSLSGRYEGKAAIEGFFRRWFERMASIRLTVRHVGFVNPIALDFANTMYVEFDTDQVTTDGLSFHTEVVGVYRLRRRKLVHYREYLFDPDLALTVWGPATERGQLDRAFAGPGVGLEAARDWGLLSGPGLRDLPLDRAGGKPQPRG